MTADRVLEAIVPRVAPTTPLTTDWSAPAWSTATTLAIDAFHGNPPHRPTVHAKLAHAGDALRALFRVRDRFVRCVQTAYQSPVWQDSCVELFVSPPGDVGYVNLEVNCGGAMLLSHVTDARRSARGEPSAFTPIAPALAGGVRIVTTMPPTTPVEIAEPIEWRVAIALPLATIEPYVGPLGDDLGGQSWRGNLFKIAAATSHPHHASWSPIGEQLWFHQPERFGRLRFAR